MTKAREVNEHGIAIMQYSESCKLVAYQDRRKIWTIAWGRTEGVKKGDTCTREQADRWFVEGVARRAGKVEKRVHVPLSSNQFSALVSLVYNIGIGSFDTSTTLHELNRGNYQAAADAFLLWHKETVVHPDGTHQHVYSKGLHLRRYNERALFLTPDGAPYKILHELPAGLGPDKLV